MFQLDLKSRKSIYEQVIDNLKELIVRGVLAPEEKLPSVRDLSKALTVNPNTVQKAYRQLENQGYVYTVSGLGTFVSVPSEIKPDTRMIEEIKGRIRADLMELRFLGLSRDDVARAVSEILKERGDIK